MSILISNTAELESNPTLKNTLRRISFTPSPFKSSLSSFNPQIQKKQEMILKDIYRKINQEEREQIRIKAHEEAQQQILQLKGKLRKNVNKENIEHIMGEKKTSRHSLLNHVMRVPTETVCVDKKHHKLINMKMSLFNEAQTISVGKSSYLKWYDANKNNQTSSPIYSRINYLLQKVGEKKQKVLLTPLRKSRTDDLLKQSFHHYMRISRKKTEESSLMKY